MQNLNIINVQNKNQIRIYYSPIFWLSLRRRQGYTKNLAQNLDISEEYIMFLIKQKTVSCKWKGRQYLSNTKM